MKLTFLVLLMAASTVAASAQTPAQPAAAAKPAAPAAAAKPAAPAAAVAAKPAAPAAKAAPATLPTVAAFIKAPANIKQYKGLPPQKALFTLALRYQDIKVGDGAVADAGKIGHFKFALWTAGPDGQKFDATEDHPGPPLKDKDGKPVLGDDGKPKLGDPTPMAAALGQGRPIPGWDMGAVGMKVHGIRRIFIPWQLGFGARDIPAQPGTHGAAPSKSDLVLDIELVDVTDAPQQPQRPGMMGGMPGRPGAPGAPPAPAHPGAAQPAAPAPAPGAAAAPKAPAPTTPPAPAAPSAPPAPAAAPATPAPAAPAKPPSQ